MPSSSVAPICLHIGAPCVLGLLGSRRRITTVLPAGSTRGPGLPRIVREARVAWVGTVSRGAGVVSASSSGAFELPVTIASRVGDPEGKTSPEELLAAAHATCFVTSLGSELARAETPPEQLEVLCTITMDEVPGMGHRIVSSAISARGTAPGADAASFAQAAEAADTGCPFSALIKASATVTVEATLEEGS